MSYIVILMSFQTIYSINYDLMQYIRQTFLSELPYMTLQMAKIEFGSACINI